MKRWIMQRSLLACWLAVAVPAMAADQAGEIEQLKRMLADQQRQIDELRHALIQKTDAPASIHTSTGQVASTTAILPAAAAPSFAPPQKTTTEESSPLQLRIGDAYITPVGFMDF